MTDNIKVAIRCRPLSEREIADGHSSIVEFKGNERVIIEGFNDQPGSKTGDRRKFLREYQFDQAFDWNSTQEQVYNKSCRTIVDSVLEGYNGTIFAYGQTGTGKTYTMEGSSSVGRRPSGGKQKQLSSKELQPVEGDDPSVGMIPRTFKHIFQYIADHPETQFLVRVSYLEIYQENIHDLLRKDQSIKLELHERPDIGVYVKDLTSFFCKSIHEIERVMRVGNQNRRVAATDMNEHSSRSHAIFMITIEQQQLRAPAAGPQSSSIGSDPGSRSNRKRDSDDGSSRSIRVGKLNLIDLAGSESQKKTKSFGDRQKESVKINLSLSALGNVINALMKVNTQPKQQRQLAIIHTPYRDSKLTRLLQDSLGGNAKTLMIANIGPANYNYDETISTLNYASRAKLIRNKPRLNEDPKDALLRELQKEIDDLRQKLADVDSSGANELKDKAKFSSISGRNNSLYKTDKNSSRNKANSEQKKPQDIPSMENNEDDNIEQELISLKQKLASLEGKLVNNKSDYDLRQRQQTIETTSTHADGLNTDMSNFLIAPEQSLLEDYMNRQEEELKAKQLELTIQTDRESAILNELERHQEVELLTKQSFSSTQHELDTKKSLIRQILVKVKQMRDTIDSTDNANILELDELEQLQYELNKELKLKCLIMDNFIPSYQVNQLLPRIGYDEQTNLCVVQPTQLPNENQCLMRNGDSVISYDEFWKKSLNLGSNSKQKAEFNQSRPKSDFERLEQTLFPGNIRFRCDHFIELSDIIIDRDEDESDLLNGKPLLSDELELHSSVLDDSRFTEQELSRSIVEKLNESLDIQEPDIVI